METLVAVVLPGLEVLQKQLVLEENLKSISTAIATVSFCIVCFRCFVFDQQFFFCQIRIKGGIPSAPPVVSSSAAAAAAPVAASPDATVVALFVVLCLFANLVFALKRTRLLLLLQRALLLLLLLL
jgi:hypothetical protein